MGGNALTSVNGIRITKDIYHNHLNVIKKVLKEFFLKVIVPSALPEKNTFGDLDFLCYGGQMPSAETLKTHPLILSKEVLVQKPRKIISFEYQHFQVDVRAYDIKSELDNDTLLMSFGGLGNMLGIGLKAMNLKWNHKGLQLNAQNLDQYVFISNDAQDICSFLQIDFNTASKATNDQDVYKALSLSKIFQYDVVKQVYLKLAESTTGLEKLRPSVKGFILYLKEHVLDQAHAESWNVDVTKQLLLEHFKHFRSELARVEESVEKARLFRSKFNGKIVKEAIDSQLDGKELGDFMANFRTTRGPEFQSFVIDSDISDITNAIKQFYLNSDFKK